MKKVLFTLLLFAFIGLWANAQDYKTSLGLRASVPYGLTIKHFVSKYNAIEGILASGWQGFEATALIENERWTGKYPGFNWFWGLGAHVGFWNAGDNPYLKNSYNGSAVIGVDGILGLEYTFDEIPLNLSVDVLPSINLIGSSGWGGSIGALSIRYVF